MHCKTYTYLSIYHVSQFTNYAISINITQKRTLFCLSTHWNWVKIAISLTCTLSKIPPGDNVLTHSDCTELRSYLFNLFNCSRSSWKLFRKENNMISKKLQARLLKGVNQLLIKKLNIHFTQHQNIIFLIGTLFIKIESVKPYQKLRNVEKPAALSGRLTARPSGKFCKPIPIARFLQQTYTL